MSETKMDLSELPRIERASPWDARAKELEESEGPCCDYVAWEEWMRKELGSFYQPDSCWGPLEAFEGMYIAERVPLYCLMCKLVEVAHA